MIVLEIREQLEHAVALFLEVVLYLPESLFKGLILHIILFNSL